MQVWGVVKEGAWLGGAVVVRETFTGQRKSLDLNDNNIKIEGDDRLWIGKGETDMNKI